MAFDWDCQRRVGDRRSWRRACVPPRSGSASRRAVRVCVPPRSATPLGRARGCPGAAWARGDVVAIGTTSVTTLASTDRSRRPGPVLRSRCAPADVSSGCSSCSPSRRSRRRCGSRLNATPSAPGCGQLVERFRERVQTDAVEGRLALALDAGELGVWTLDVRSGVAEWSLEDGRAARRRADEGWCRGPVRRRASPTTAARSAAPSNEPARSGTPDDRVPASTDARRGIIWLSTRVSRVQAEGGPLGPLGGLL